MQQASGGAAAQSHAAGVDRIDAERLTETREVVCAFGRSRARHREQTVDLLFAQTSVVQRSLERFDRQSHRRRTGQLALRARTDSSYRSSVA